MFFFVNHIDTNLQKIGIKNFIKQKTRPGTLFYWVAWRVLLLQN